MQSAVPTKPVSIRELLHQHLRREDSRRHAYHLHASDITSDRQAFCAREAVLSYRLHLTPRTERVDTATAVTWDWGRRTEERVREWFADMGRLVGDWQCRHAPCRKLFKWCTRPKQCPVCKGESFQYEEHRAVSAVSGIGYGPDLFVNMDLPKLRHIEVKSIDKEKFKDLLMPLSEHRERTLLGLRCMAESEDPAFQQVDTERADILYVSKGGYGTTAPEMAHWAFWDGKFSPFKTYAVLRNDAEVEDRVQTGKIAVAGLNGGPVPPRLTSCTGLASPRAQACPAADACYSAKGW